MTFLESFEEDLNNENEENDENNENDKFDKKDESEISLTNSLQNKQFTNEIVDKVGFDYF